MRNAQYWIKRLNLQPHPEGGFYHETFRSDVEIPQNALPVGFATDHKLATAIYFLLDGCEFSAFHRLQSDEFWFWHTGEAIELVILESETEVSTLCLGLGDNQQPFAHIPANKWFAARVVDEQSYALMSCMVTPGFEFADFELATRQQLLSSYPDHTELIKQFTR